MSKKYSSYDQINTDLEILKLEKEIHLQHVLLNIDRTKESLQPENLFQEALESCKTILSNTYTSVLQIAISSVINRFINKKRGD